MKLLVATGNAHKLEEFARILGPLGIEIVAPADVKADMNIEEIGETFAENALQKALALHEQTGLPTVADDSGLSIDALDGRPGIYSACYQGEDTPYPQKMEALLQEMKDVPAEKRTARFTCAIACVLGSNQILSCVESCEGYIGFAPSGGGGFGYDPLFFVEGESFAEISPQQKDAISHRGKALRAFAGELAGLL